MKKKIESKKQLKLSRESLRRLSAEQMQAVRGGVTGDACNSKIEEDACTGAVCQTGGSCFNCA